ncbi:MAG: tyrosine-protein phosphatase [Deltaproteobacteria bacterium]|nr:tyrosine-protein phosphatase [Deltaproteobacteria bacterium]
MASELLNQRHIELVGQSNFRDMGGYQAVCGRRVKWGRIYRSGELAKLAEGDVTSLAALGIRTAVDFRSTSEVELRGSDRLPAEASVLSLPIDSGDLISKHMPEVVGGDFSNVPADFLQDVNRSLIADWSYQFASLLDIIADTVTHPLVFHCTHGKDRAGLAAAIVLSALGVPWDLVQEDYLLSNRYRKQTNDMALDRIRQEAARQRGVSPEEIDMSNVKPLFFVEVSNIDAARDAMISNYGSIDTFIRERLGWGEGDLVTLRAELLE